MSMRIPEAFYRVHTQEESGGIPLVWARGEVLWQKTVIGHCKVLK